MDDEKMTGRHFSVSSSVSEGTAPAGKRFAHAAAPEPEVGSTAPEPAPSPEPEADVQAATGSAGEVVDGSSSTLAVEDGAKALEKKSKRRIALRVLLGVVIVLAVAVAAGAIYINQSIARGRKAFDDSMSQAIEEKGKTVVYNGKTYALNTDTGKATGIVIPRDSMVDVDTYISGNYNGTHAMQICLQYSYGSTSEESSELVARCASRVLYGMPIDYYFTLNVEGVGPLNDAVGGVTLVPVQSVPSVGISEGVETTLYGKTAERYVQFRDTSTLTSSLDRQRRQVSYLKAFTSKVLQNATGDPAALLSLYQTALDYTWTNLGFDQFSYLASTMLAKGMTSFDVVTLDGEMGEGETYAEFHLNQDAVYQTVLDTYYTPVDE